MTVWRKDLGVLRGCCGMVPRECGNKTVTCVTVRD